MDLDKLEFNQDGLIPVIVQSIDDGQVLMFAYGNRQSIEMSIDTSKAHYWSRSRNRIWMKGEESGNTQELVDAFYDCDSDVLLYLVKQKGAACHTKNKTCFYRKLDGTEKSSPLFISESIIKNVYRVIEERKSNTDKESYVSGLFGKGIDKILKKIGEEAGEIIIAAKNKDKDELVYEITDLWFHSLIAMSYFGIKPDDIDNEFNRRFGRRKKDYGRD